MDKAELRRGIPGVLKLALFAAGAAGAYAAWRRVERARREKQNRNLPHGQKIVILGAGFAGTNVARELAKLLPHPEHGEITLVDEDDYLLFTPMLTEAAGGELETRHIVSPLGDLPARIRFEQGRVTEIDLDKKQVRVESAANGGVSKADEGVLSADHLVIALGSVPNFHDIAGLEEHSLTMKSLGDAAAIRNHALEMLARAEVETDERAGRAFLTFIVGGAGFTGVETMAAINDLVRATARDNPRISAEKIRAIIAGHEDRLLPELSSDLAAYAQQKLEAHGIEVRLKTKITGAGEGYVRLEGGERLETRTFIWAGGVKPSPIAGGLNCQYGRHGGIAVDGCCQVLGRPGVWALGDCAEVPKKNSTGTYAPTAQNATREGSLVARNIVAVMRGAQPKSFTYHPVGELAVVGRHSGVARIYGMNFSGVSAWLLWRAVYWAKMPDGRQRARILADWILDFILGRPVAALRLESGGKHLPVSEGSQGGR